MSCIIDDGYKTGCVSTGGLQKVYLGTWSSDFVYTLDVDNVITGIASSPLPTVFLFEQEAEASGLVQNGQYSRENFTVFQESLLSIKMNGLSKELRNTFQALSRAPLIALVQTVTGEWFYLGKESPGRASEGTLSAGVLLSDMNGATLTFSWRSPNGAFAIDPEIIGEDILIGA